jgi:hypothetical protein
MLATGPGLMTAFEREFAAYVAAGETAWETVLVAASAWLRPATHAMACA